MTYLIKQHFYGFDWHTEIYAIFDSLDKMLEHMRAEIGDDYYSDWLNGGHFFTVYKVKDPLLKDMIEIDHQEELYKKYPEVADMVRYRERKHMESMDGIGILGAVVMSKYMTMMANDLNKTVQGS